ncbi:MAG TPA: hypothetical protein VMI10_01405 [Terriglobales bacterium]|nr:hypothetical protein [Terriglobales bacterium]
MLAVAGGALGDELTSEGEFVVGDDGRSAAGGFEGAFDVSG